MTELENNVISFGEDFENPLATRLRDMGVQESVSTVTVERLGSILERIGTSWSNFTFNHANRKAEVMPALQDKWRTFSEIATLDSKGRTVVLNRFARSLGVKPDRATRTQIEFVAAKGVVSSLLKRGRPVEQFLDGVDPKIKFLTAPYILLEAVLELSGYPNPQLDSLQEFLAESYRKGQLGHGPYGCVELSELLSALNNWIPTLNRQTK